MDYESTTFQISDAHNSIAKCLSKAREFIRLVESDESYTTCIRTIKDRFGKDVAVKVLVVKK